MAEGSAPTQVRAAGSNLDPQQLKAASGRGVTFAARVGYFTHGLVYGLIGVLALMAALGSGGGVTDSRGVLHRIGEWGAPLLWIAALGLACYAIWNVVRALFDPEGIGARGKALFKRIGYAASALTHVFLSIYAFQLARGAANGGDGRRRTIAQVFDLPGGRILIGVVGLCIIAFGLAELYSAYKNRVGREFYDSRLKADQRRWVLVITRIGRAARGVVFPIIGISVIAAAFDANPGEAHSFGEALGELASQPFGSLLLGIVAVGLVAYGTYQLLVAFFARIAKPT